MKKIFITMLASCLVCFVQAQVPTQDPYPDAPLAAVDINQYAIYIDSVSNVNEQLKPFSATNNNSVAPSAINLTGVSTGVHQLYIKVIATNGKSSIFAIGNFYMEGDNLYQNPVAVATDINQYAFYIDSVSNGNEQLKPFAATNNNTVAPTPISLTGVNSGVHQLYAKVISTNGKASIFAVGNFYMLGDNLYQNPPAPAIDINQYSFYIDSVSIANEQLKPFAATTNNTVAPSPINLAGVSAGVHQLYAKVTTTDGKPSILNIGNFYMEGDNLYQNVPAAAANINRYEFYVDSVSNVNIQPLSFTSASNNATPNANIDLTAVLPGVHQLYARVFDINNKPSIMNLGNFSMDQLYRYPNAVSAAPPIANMEYYFDTDPGYGLGTAITVGGASTNEQLSNVVVNFPNGFPAGIHYLHIRSKQNPWSIDNVVPFTTLGIVPVIWQNVQAQLINNQTHVSWATSQEINSNLFEIEHSIDGINFVKIGERAAAGNSSNISYYNFTHLKPAAGFNYYRIKQIDVNGSYKYSVIVKVLNRNDIKETIIAPNPVSNVLNVVEPTSKYISSIDVYDNKAALIMHKSIQTDVQVYSLPVGTLRSGNYLLKINYKTESKSILFIKE